MTALGLLGAVLVELFTSEGCSSCPPADRLLAELEAEGAAASVEIVPLSFHVDYWNYLGWRDPFSSREFTARQRRYGAGVYTPQMIVDGAEAFVGSDRRAAQEAIAAAARRPRLQLDVRSTVVGEALVAVEVRIDAAGLDREAKRAEVLLAVTENGLASNVTRGENSGRKLSHAAVVRKLVSLGEVSFDGTSSVERAHTVRLEKDWNPERLHAAVWVQGSERVLGAARRRLSSGREATEAVDLFDGFRSGWDEEWMARRLAGATEYVVVDDEDAPALSARSRGTASALVRKLDPVAAGTISWRWKVAMSLSPNSREREKEGDDYAARLLVVFGSEPFSARSTAICYVWAAEEEPGAAYPNPYASNVRTLVLRSGDDRSGEWVREERDLDEDYRALFGETPSPATAVAVMVDTDDTGKSAGAWFTDLRFEPSE